MKLSTYLATFGRAATALASATLSVTAFRELANALKRKDVLAAITDFGTGATSALAVYHFIRGKLKTGAIFLAGSIAIAGVGALIRKKVK